MIPPSVAISIENGGDSATPIQLAFLACLGHIDLTCSWAREREGSLVRPDIDLPRKTPMPKDICQAVMYRIQEKLLHIVSNGEKLSSNRRGGTARSFGDKCFLRRSDPVERKSSSFFSSLRKAIVNIRAEVVSE
ncbi:hypothetical protein L1987_89048 [Smallanthus sonchifolius]|nr:hypothetical protein L1987_89048 [Smallanthus sonchifolius]